MKTPALLSAKLAIAKGNAAGFEFVLRELELGLAFFRMASDAKSDGEKKRRIKNASHSYEAAMFHAQSLTLNEGEQTGFNQKAEKLRLLLH